MQGRQERVDKALRQFLKEIKKYNKSITSRMEAAGYSVNKTGVCAGITGMAMQAWFLSGYEGIKQFEKRHKLILEMDENEFAKVKYRNTGRAVSKPSYYLFQNPKSNVEQYRDIDAFFDGIQSYQEDRVLIRRNQEIKRGISLL